MSAPEPFKVVIAGGGVAALEAALALRELAGDRVSITLVAPNAEFSYRPLSVREPFAYAKASQYPIAALATEVGAELVSDEFAWVDAAAQIIHTASAATVAYDALLLALGARASEAFSHVLTIDDRRMDAQLHGLIQDIEEGYVHSVAFLAPARLAWPLPLYELALMTAARAYDMDVEVALTIVTAEEAPLAVFGPEASSAVAELLSDAGIRTLTLTRAQVPETGRVVVQPGELALDVDRIVALPELFGPAVRGLPAGEHGFIPVDRFSKVRGVERVWAAGDATDFAVKHGGVAAQQADTAAASIAALAGASLTPEPFHPEIHGMLLTGRRPRYLSARLTGDRGFSSQLTEQPTWEPVVKISARYLAPYLARSTPDVAPAE